MICRQMVTASSSPPMGALLGTTGSAKLLESINQQYPNAGVIFSQASDPRSDRYAAFMRTVVDPIKEASKQLAQIKTIVFDPNRIYAIDSVEQLDSIPPALMIPILTEPTIRQLHQQGKLYGWGIDPASVPEEDVDGRMIDNNYCYFNHPDESLNKDVWSFEWCSTDPERSEEDLEIIQASRNFIREFALEQLETDRQDPTNCLATMPGKLKRIK